GNLLAIFGAPFRDREARELMARFPGFIQLQAALLDGTPDLSRHETWRRLAEEDVRLLRQRSWWHHLELQLRAYEWGVPPQEVLDQAKGLRQRLDEQAKQGFGGTKDSIVMVAGRAPFTPDGFETGADGLVYLDARDGGDSRVTLKSLRLEGVRVWQLDSDHGSLPERKEAFEVYQELLEKGTTTRLKPLLPPTRGGAEQQPISHVRSRPSRARPASRPPETSGELLGAASTGPVAVGRPDQVPLQITVHNGDLTFVREPLLIGHYRSSRLTGTESVMDRVIGKLMSEALKVGDYPDLPGTYATFPNAQPPQHNPWQLPRPEAVIVVGLGPEGGLRSSDLIETVRKGVVGWARVEARRPGGVPVLFDLAATLIGSGGKGISTGQSARLIAQGVRDANRRLAEADLPRVGHLHLIELYLDRATEAWRALRILMEGASAEYLVTDTIEIGAAALTRPPDLGYRGADYDFLSAVTPEHGGEGLIEYTLDTKRARSEVRAQATQSKLIRAMVEEASNDANSDPQIGNTLCRLLLPLDLDPFVGGTSELVIELDGGTAGIPWELFDADSPRGRETTPWSIRSKLVRKLRTADFRQQVREADLDAGALVIGEPLADREIYPELPGAREEAMAVARCLRGPHGLGSERVHLLVGSDTEPGPDAQTALNALLNRDSSWRIVHIAGHGEPATVVESTSPQPGQPPQKYGGVVLSNKTFLGPREIRSMRLVPELVFVNCCHLGTFRPEQLLTAAQRELGRPYDRAMFAYGVAEELIKIGVRCVVAAGWAVNDDAAKAFAETFYSALLRNERFGNAVAQAREAARALGGNTWAAYQCYGDPDWMLQRATGDPQRPAGLDAARGIEPAEEFAGVASPPGLTLALESLSVGSRFQGKPAESQRTKIRYLEERFGQLWGDLGSVAEGFAEAWDAAGDQHKAIDWYRRALAAGDGSASLRATEELGKLLVHQGEAELIGSATADSGKTRKRARAKPKVSGNGAAAESIKHARSAVEEGIGRLEKVLALEPSMERESLLGFAYKRLAMIAAAQGDTKEETMAIAEMEQHYARAEELGRKGRLADRYYPLM
ncbi:MAG TPA: CHAT domain-containing protein, partial [Gemmatimonadales bacterium]|nr:CHAT domain-containing protein [Gemmatimonadales bacterium]